MTGPDPRVSVVVVSYRTPDQLLECLTALRTAAETVPVEVVVIDNAAGDGSRERVAEAFDEVVWLTSPGNVGFAKAVNVGIRATTSPAVLLLNPDVVVRPDTLLRLLGRLDADPGLAAVGPRTVHPQGRLRVLAAGHLPTARRVARQFLLFNLLPGTGVNLMAHDDQDLVEVEWLSGGALLVRRSVVDSVGLLTERWFMYGEDLEWCGRMVDAGWRLAHDGAAEVTHAIGSSPRDDGSVSTLWVSALCDVYRLRERPGLLRLTAFRLSLASGLLVRAALYRLRARQQPEHAAMWRDESRKFLRYARVPFARPRADQGDEVTV